MSRHSFSDSFALQRRQRGVSIITAIFLLLLFAALAAYMVSMTNTADVTSAQDVQGERAYHAAQAGLEWGAYQVLVPVGAGCRATLRCRLAQRAGMVAVTVTCVVSGPLPRSAIRFSVYRLTSLARNAAAVGSAAYMTRAISLWLTAAVRQRALRSALARSVERPEGIRARNGDDENWQIHFLADLHRIFRAAVCRGAAERLCRGSHGYCKSFQLPEYGRGGYSGMDKSRQRGIEQQ